MDFMDRKLRIGTRGSPLALWQARTVERRLKESHPDLATEIVIIKTEGDVNRAPLERISGEGLFTKELDAALLDDRIDVGVHSLKDLPTRMREGIELAAVPERAAAEDAFVSIRHARFEDLPRGARVATGSPRRRALLLAARPDLTIVDLRGNVDTRLRKLEEGYAEAILLACAGLMRLGLEDRITQRLPLDRFVSAPGQGALGITVRDTDGRARDPVSVLEHKASRAAVDAERAFLFRLGGGCKTPIAGYGEVRGAALSLRGFLARPDGTGALTGEVKGSASDAEIVGIRLAERFLKKGAKSLI